MDEQQVTANQVPETTPEYQEQSDEKPDQNVGVENASGGMFEEHGQNEVGEDDLPDDKYYEGQGHDVDEEEERDEDEDEAPTGPIQGGIYHS